MLEPSAPEASAPDPSARELSAPEPPVPEPSVPEFPARRFPGPEVADSLVLSASILSASVLGAGGVRTGGVRAASGVRPGRGAGAPRVRRPRCRGARVRVAAAAAGRRALRRRGPSGRLAGRARGRCGRVLLVRPGGGVRGRRGRGVLEVRGGLEGPVEDGAVLGRGERTGPALHVAHAAAQQLGEGVVALDVLADALSAAGLQDVEQVVGLDGRAAQLRELRVQPAVEDAEARAEGRVRGTGLGEGLRPRVRRAHALVRGVVEPLGQRFVVLGRGRGVDHREPGDHRPQVVLALPGVPLQGGRVHPEVPGAVGDGSAQGQRLALEDGVVAAVGGAVLDLDLLRLGGDVGALGEDRPLVAADPGGLPAALGHDLLDRGPRPEAGLDLAGTELAGAAPAGVRDPPGALDGQAQLLVDPQQVAGACLVLDDQVLTVVVHTCQAQLLHAVNPPGWFSGALGVVERALRGGSVGRGRRAGPVPRPNPTGRRTAPAGDAPGAVRAAWPRAGARLDFCPRMVNNLRDTEPGGRPSAVPEPARGPAMGAKTGHGH